MLVFFQTIFTQQLKWLMWNNLNLSVTQQNMFFFFLMNFAEVDQSIELFMMELLVVAS